MTTEMWQIIGLALVIFVPVLIFAVVVGAAYEEYMKSDKLLKQIERDRKEREKRNRSI